MKHLSWHRLFASALLILATTSALQAQDWYWTGAVSENWSDTGNWNSAADGSGAAPADIAQLSGKSIMLRGDGAYQPANQDIEGLAIKNLMMDATVVSFDMRGAPLTFDVVNNTGDPSANQTVRFFNPLVTTSSSGWSVKGKLSLELWGGYGESGGSRSFACNYGGNVHFYGPVTITGGFHHNQATANYYGIETTGVFPAEFDEDYFSTGYGVMAFRLPPETAFYRYRFPATVGGKTTQTLNLRTAENVDVVFDGPICGAEGKAVEISSPGTVYLNGKNTFPGDFKPNGGMTVLGGSLAPGGKIVVNLGTLDLFGHDVLGRTLTFENGWGVSKNGGIVNSDEEHEATLDGDITKLASNANVAQFGGRGDIRLEGDITDTTGSRLFQKLGTGRLTFAGSSVNPNGFSVKNGTLALDYTANNGDKIADSANLSLAGSLDLIGSADADSVEVLKNLTLGEYAVKIRPEGRGGHAAALRVSALALSSGGTLGIEPSGDGSVGILAPANSVLGILGARAVYDGSSYARAAAEAGVDGYTLIEPLPDAAYTAGFDADSSTEIADIVDNTTIDAVESVGAIRFASASASKLTLNANLQILGEKQDSNGHNGAILVTPARGAGETVIEGGGLIGPNFVNGSLYIHQENAAAPLVVRSRLFNTSSGNTLVKSGPGELRLEHPENAFAYTRLLEGTLTATSVTNSGSNSAAGQCGALTIGAATFRYVGEGGESDMDIWTRGGSVFDASGTGPLVLTSAKGVQYIDETGRDAAITFAGTGEGELRGPVGIAYGQVRKQGTGKWTLSCATNSLFWGAVVEQGELCVTGFFGRDITVRNGATLSGSPTIQRDLVLESGATLLLDPAAPMAVGYDVSVAEGANLVLTERLPFDKPVTVLTYGGKFNGVFTTDRPDYRVACEDGTVVVTRKSSALLIIVR